jgi:hypothetical protein
VRGAAQNHQIYAGRLRFQLEMAENRLLKYGILFLCLCGVGALRVLEPTPSDIVAGTFIASPEFACLKQKQYLEGTVLFCDFFSRLECVRRDFQKENHRKEQLFLRCPLFFLSKKFIFKWSTTILFTAAWFQV